jgi:hypothetical protein
MEIEMEMEKTQEENNTLYIQDSKKNIDKYIYRNEYKKAFVMLLIVLERLDDTEKIEFIDYYTKKLNSLFVYYTFSHLKRPL